LSDLSDVTPMLINTSKFECLLLDAPFMIETKFMIFEISYK
jgi:hypothetical protein